MTALWIILGIFAFLFLLLLCPITLTAGYETQLEAKLRFLFFSYRLAPKKEKKPPKKGKAKKQEEGSPAVQESKLKQLIKERGFAGFLRLMKELAQLSWISRKGKQCILLYQDSFWPYFFSGFRI